ncbi:DUF1552 domain-containing protein [Planctomicrobium sp. SH661]|uniref:DUF1552 domain-containing protein n=1 Tax=Planctomicrobium sp. SH661 TaxID=3448124 RepID=UPI003F5BB235
MKPISRRTLLKGTGAALALPVLDAMVPRAAWAAPEMLVRNRMGFVYVPNGAIMQSWTPEQTGENYQLSKTLSPLQDLQQDILVLSGLSQNNARALGDGAGDHARDSACYLTAQHPRKSDSDIYVGVSVDQLAAKKLGHLTRLPSLELGLEGGRQAGNCDSGYGCIYSSNISWSSATTPMAKEIRPRAVFERMFGDGQDPKTTARRNFFRQSILDFVADDAARLNTTLGTSDRHKLDEYLTSVREVEQRIARSAIPIDKIPEFVIPDEPPETFQEQVRLMYDLMVLAFQTDTTRICTLMLANSGSNRTYKEIGVVEAHHQISHHQNDEEKMGSLQKIDQHMIEQFAYFLNRLKQIREGDGTLLDHSMFMYGAALADPNRHQHHDLPILVAGRGSGTIRTGRHIQYPENTPLANLFVSMLNGMQVPTDVFGDSSGNLADL